MFSKKQFIIKLHSILWLSIIISSCGGGGGSSSLPSRAVDNIAPFVTSFSPVGSGFATSTAISVTFSESVSIIKANNISLTQTDVNGQKLNNIGLPDTVLVLDSTQNNTVLDINLANAGQSLQADTIYRVDINGVQDRADTSNTMFGTCSWYFATGTAIISPTLANSVKCNTQVNTGSSNWDELIWDQDNWN